MELWALLWIHKLIRSPVRYSSLRLRSCSLSLLGRTAHGIWTQAQGILSFNYWIKCPFPTCRKLCQNTHEVWTGKGGKGVGGNKMVPPFTLHYRHPWTNLDVNCPLFTWFSSPSFPFNFPIHVGELAGITATCCEKKFFVFLVLARTLLKDFISPYTVACVPYKMKNGNYSSAPWKIQSNYLLR